MKRPDIHETERQDTKVTMETRRPQSTKFLGNSFCPSQRNKQLHAEKVKSTDLLSMGTYECYP